MARPALLIPILILPLLLSLSAPLILTKLRIFGLYNRELRELNNAPGQCERILSLRSCEDTWLHSDSGLLYAACGNSPEDRQTWFPCNDHWDVLARTGRDYLAVLDTRNVSAGSSHTARTKVLKLRNFHGLAGEGSLTVHGMGTWVDPSDPERLRLFIVNHRPPVDALTGAVQLEGSQRGANSTIEIFETRLGSDEATHVRTVAHPLIRTPNDVDGIDGDSFYVTNDHHVKRGHRKILDMFFPLTEVVHCDLTGCKVALKGLTFANGIARDARNPLTWYLSATASEKFYVLTRNERDNTLQIDAEVNLPYPTDNIYASPDEGGGAYVTVFPRLPELLDHFHHPRTKGSAAGVMKISKNDQHDAFFGEKYKVERVYEDLDVDPESPSGITGVAVDEQRGKMFLASLYQPHMWECNILEKPHRVKFA